jgi:hypothetical protein
MVSPDCYSPGSTRMSRLLAAALVCWVVLVLKLDAGQVDSGWAIARQQPFTLNSQSADPGQQLLLHHMLQQIESPLLQNPAHEKAPTATNGSAKAATTAQGSVRFAVRPDGVDGWRPAEQNVAPLQGPWHVGLQAPQLNAPGNAHPPTEIDYTVSEPVDEDESDCRDGETGQDGQTTDEWEPAERNDATDDTPAEDSEAAKSSSISVVDEDTEVAEEPPTDEPMEEADPAEEADVADQADQPAEEQPNTDEHEETGPITDESTVEPVNKPTPPPPLTKQLTALRTRVRGVLKGYYRRQLNSREHDPWEVMHGMLAYGVHSRIRQGGPRGAPVTSVGWLCYNKPCKNLTLMYVTPKGELRAKYGVGLQGHLGQLLAMLAQCRVSDEYPIRVGKREFAIRDLIEAEKKTCYPKSELTFKLLAFQYYLDLNDTWVNDQGVEWDFPRVIREELAQPIRGAACGGTHRLSSLSLTVKARQRRGDPLDGEYARAAEFVKKYHRYAFSLQNRDGSLSTEWFRGRGDDSDIDRRIKTTGHILEWLCYSLSDEELRLPKTIAAVNYLTNLMSREYDHEWEVGPMSHATHALLIYDERVFQPFDTPNYSAIYKPTRKSPTATAKRGQVRTMRR